MGIHPEDFLIPVCEDSMNRSQVMRVALTSVVERLGVDELGVMTPWVSRAHLSQLTWSVVQRISTIYWQGLWRALYIGNGYGGHYILVMAMEGTGAG